MLIHFVGCDGSGKTTIINLLKDCLQAKYIREPSPETKLKLLNVENTFDEIKLFAEDREKLYNTIKVYDDQLTISDRSYICSLTYQSLKLESEFGCCPFDAISEVFNAQPSNIIKPELVIFLYSTPFTLFQRCNARQEYMTIKYAESIIERYKLIFKLFNLNVIYFDTGLYPLQVTVDKIKHSILTL
jgi:thymidylate kinase